MRLVRILCVTVCMFVVGVQSSTAAPIPLAPAVLGGSAAGTGPWTLNTTAVDFAFVTFETLALHDFSELLSLSVSFESLAGGGGLGSPRLRVLLDVDNSGTITGADRSLTVHLGGAPDYVDTSAELNAFSGVNLLNNDAGRFDTAAFAGGSPFTTYATTLALVGNLDILRLGVVADNYAGRAFRLDSINTDVAAVPEPVSLSLLGGGLAAMVARRRFSKRA